MSEPTSATLLERIRDVNDEDAWSRFVAFYQPMVHRYARRQGCSEAMAWDVVQETLVDLMSIMPRFEYRPGAGNFRAFLRRVVWHRVSCAFRRERRYVPLDGESAPETATAGAEDDGRRPDRAWEQEWQEQLLQTALRRLREQVEERTFAAFHAYAIAGRDPEHVCAELGMTPNALYQIRHRLMTQLRRTVEWLEGELDHDGP